MLLWLAMFRVLRLAALGVGALLVGCRAVPVEGNNLPIPPPAELIPKAAGVYQARGDSEKPGSTVWIVNDRSNLTFGQDTADGQYDFLIFGECGDLLMLTWTTETASSGVRRQVIGDEPEHGCEAPDAGP